MASWMNEERTTLQRLRGLVADLGWRVMLIHLLYKFIPLPARRVKLRSEFLKHPVYARLRSSDIVLFRSIFCRREFACLDDLDNPKLIIDCGSNVGFTAAYFLSRFPEAKLVAVEPESGNFAMLQDNLAPYADRYRLIKSAVWSSNTGLRIVKYPTGAMKEWSTSVEETKPGEPEDLHAMTIGELFAEAQTDRISLLKIDVEGAEKSIFNGPTEPWLSRTDVLTIELHGDDCTRIFEKAVADQNFTMIQSGELTVCKRT